jgi:hypothetical protein
MDLDKASLLFEPYRTPALKVGERTLCLLRDMEVVIYGWSTWRIPWPLCYRAGTRAFGKGFLVDDELARAIRSELACAVQYWWGISQKTTCNWRRSLEVYRTDVEGSRRLIRLACERGLNARRKFAPVKVKLWTHEDWSCFGDSQMRR